MSLCEILQGVVILLSPTEDCLIGEDHLVTELETHQLLVLPPVPQLQPHLAGESDLSD